MPELRLKTRVLAQGRFTQFLCQIPDKGGAYVQMSNPALCSGKSTKIAHFSDKNVTPGFGGEYRRQRAGSGAKSDYVRIERCDNVKQTRPPG
jgi:hypothetical protein